MEELRRRLEVLIGAAGPAPLDQSEKARTAAEAERLARREQVAAAGGRLLSAAFSFLGEIIPPAGDAHPSDRLAGEIRERLDECLDKDENGRLKLTVALPDASALDHLAVSLARLLDLRSAGTDGR